MHTGVWKQAVTGPRMVRRLNIDGDGQGDLAGHGGEHRAVLVYQTDSYRYWEKELGRDDFVSGQFGENFTVEGLPDDEVCIGDRYRIGGAVFEVSQPRVTCYRVGLRMGEPQMAALLVSHRRPGFYFRVLVEGEVEAGQEITKIASDPVGMSVAEIDALLYLPGHPRDGIDRALRVPALSPGWRTSLEAVREQAEHAPPGSAGNAGLSPAATGPPAAWTGFRPLTVARLHEESRSVVSLWLAASDRSALPPWRPGQAITLRLRPEGATAPLIRSYSLSGPPGAAEYRISVKQEPHGAVSSLLHTRVRVGDALDVAAPRGTFFLKDSEDPVLLLSAGVGATPVLAMLHALADASSRRQVWWLHGARDRAEHAFAAESRALLGRLAGSHSFVCYSRPAEGDRKGVDYTAKGRLSATLLGGLGLPQDADAYLCGPAEFMTGLAAALGSSGLDPARIHTEAFGAGAALTPGVVSGPGRSPHQPAGPAGTGPTVSFARSGLTVRWDPERTSLLELAEACDVPTRWSCRTGICHTCETALLSGAVDYSPEPIDEPADGNALICCSSPMDSVVLDL
ncbi:MOSC and FAD-binding oxidoreductase domain-containing protein [Streptomyces sp. AK02-01A]|uniref:MOSC and FAD-binding oxidoreductase domain-containing protein n=1 Tax=Streptomyces sp. AK02-01A TaxID=3028648 RepID=UPI0029CA95A5|nr:MOSC and FAD-binding oxidoreductase domain-containing protein [Streptomyces sp. AK02-01A]